MRKWIFWIWNKEIGNPISVPKKKIANELAECREERLPNQRQHQKENIKNGSADHIRQERLANQHQYQNEKNVYSATITDEIRKFHATVQSTLVPY